jgi:hypothetical protein
MIQSGRNKGNDSLNVIPIPQYDIKNSKFRHSKSIVTKMDSYLAVLSNKDSSTKSVLHIKENLFTIQPTLISTQVAVKNYV